MKCSCGLGKHWVFIEMELIRDTTLGKFVRLLGGKQLLPYPEEVDPSAWTSYVQHSQEKGDPDIIPEICDEICDSYGMYTVFSQATLTEPNSRRGSFLKYGNEFKTIGWTGPGDIEV